MGMTGEEMIRTCEQLLQDPELEGAVRVGDIFALMVEYFVSQSNFREAFECIERMRQEGTYIQPYLDRSLVEQVYNEVGQPLQAEAEDEGEEIDEEVDEIEDDGRV